MIGVMPVLKWHLHTYVYVGVADGTICEPRGAEALACVCARADCVRDICPHGMEGTVSAA